jgi:hypothetical protein
MTLLRDVDNVPPKKPMGLYALIAVVVIASAAYMFPFRTSTGLESNSTADAPSLTASVDVPVSPASPSESDLPPSEADRAEIPPPTEEPVVALEAEPVPAPPPVVLQVVADVDGADVFIDRSYVGTTPFESTTLGPGRYRVNVSASGYETYEEDIEIGGEPASIVVTFRQVSLDEQVAVIHKHRFGNCAGKLVASTTGIRYQTSDDDAFEITFEAMEEFAVDYLENNLRIKVREGRTYNFTDEQDNADTLLVFHRAVENARGRLALGDRPVLP